MRRFFSILLLALFGLPAVAPLFSFEASAASSVPACCRKNGQHHCGKISAGDAASSQGDPTAYPGLWAKGETCPYAPSTAPRIRGEVLLGPVAQAIFAGLVSHPAPAAQTECLRRIARDRSRQKRGPPVSTHS